MKLVFLSLVAAVGLFAVSAGIANADDPDDDWDWDWNHFSDHHHDHDCDDGHDGHDHDDDCDDGHDHDDDDCRIIGAAFGAVGGAISWEGGGWAGNWGGGQAFSSPDGCHPNLIFVFVPAGFTVPGITAGWPTSGGSMFGGYPGGFPGFPGGHLLGHDWWEQD